MAAPRPRPAGLKVLEGRGNGRDSGGRKIATPPSFKRLPPEPPEWLEGEAAALWARTVPELARLDLVKQPDAPAMTAYCETWARFVAAVKMRHELGIVHENSQGVCAAPWIGVEERAGRELRAFAIEFGLTPAAEMKLAKTGSDDGGEENPFSNTG